MSLKIFIFQKKFIPIAVWMLLKTIKHVISLTAFSRVQILNVVILLYDVSAILSLIWEGEFQ